MTAKSGAGSSKGRGRGKSAVARGAEAEVDKAEEPKVNGKANGQAETPAAGMGHNLGPISREKFFPLYTALQRAQAEEAEARAKVKKIRKQMKAEGVMLKVFDSMVTLAELPLHEQRDQLAQQKQILEFLRAPVGTQMSLLDIIEPDPLSVSEDADAKRAQLLEEDAKGKGFLAGISGRPESENPHEGNTPAGMAWLAAYREGREKYVESAEGFDG